MKKSRKLFAALLAALCAVSAAVPAAALSFEDAHGNVVELDETLEAYSETTLTGADDAARKAETNLGDLWTDALRWFAVSGRIADYYDEDDVALGNTGVAVDEDHIVALWNGGNLRADIPAGTFGAEALAEVLPYPNRVAVVYMTGADLTEALEAASQGLPYTEETAAAAASFMQVSGLSYVVDTAKEYDRGEEYGANWYKAASLSRVSVSDVNGKACDPEATYAVITSNANYNGMDSSYKFAEAVEADERSAITTAVVRDVIWEYIAEVLENRIGAEYAEPQGRITVQHTTPSIPAEDPAAAPAFEDVDADAYYAEAVNWAVEQSITAGTSATAFSPDAVCTRAQTVTFLWRAAGSPAPESAENPFSDVEEGAYYYDAVLWAVEQNITAGTSETAFSPDDPCTRGQVATFLYRAAGTPEVEAADAFEDVEEGAYYADAVNWAVANAITTGVSETEFAPASPCTRAQIVTFLYRNANN